jgi:hypothetical protein
MRTSIFTGATAALLLISGSAPAADFDDALLALAKGKLAEISADRALIDAIRAQNARNIWVDAAEIDKLDKSWRAQVGQGSAPMIAEVAATPASARLVAIRKEAGGMFTEIFVMDDKGLTVALSDATSDYWQGDEAKWQQTYLVGAGAVHTSEVELDDSTQACQGQVSLTVVDPDTKAPIGAITFGVNVDAL